MNSSDIKKVTISLLLAIVIVLTMIFLSGVYITLIILARGFVTIAIIALLAWIIYQFKK